MRAALAILTFVIASASAAVTTTGWENHRLAANSAFVPYFEDTFTTNDLQPPGGLNGWAVFAEDIPGFATGGYDAANGAYYGRIWPDPYRFRISGIISNYSGWLPYSAVGPGSIVRAKYYVFRAGQQDPADLNQVPNFRLRVSARFAQSAMLEVFHHLAADPSMAPYATELRPSDNPSSPSLYRVDFDPVDVPYLTGSSVEGLLRALEAYALEPQENGDIAITESVIGTYPATLLSAASTTDILRKVYEPGLHDAGNLAIVTTATDLRMVNVIDETLPGDFVTEDWSDQPKPSYAEAGTLTPGGLPGITMDTSLVPLRRIGLVARELHPGPDATDPSYLRVEEGKQYQIRWHLTSTQMSNRQAQIRMRVRSVKFCWSHKLEIGGAWAAGSANNTIALQTLPGIGTQNPDRNGTEDGGWYSQIVQSPLSPDIRPEFAPDVPVALRMPAIAGEPGPGVDAPSRRDLRLGIDLLDTITRNPNAHLETGQFTLDRVEVRVHDFVTD